MRYLLGLNLLIKYILIIYENLTQKSLPVDASADRLPSQPLSSEQDDYRYGP